jgi:hypothetical protein
MWRVWAFLGAAVWCATIAASGLMNYLAGYQFGESAFESRVFALLGLSADVWKAIGPIFILTLWRARRPVPAALAGSVWVVCFVFAVSAALGLAARNRGAVVGEREDSQLSYRDVEQELAAAEKRRAEFGSVASPAEKEAAIAAALARALPGGTVGSLSQSCSRDLARTRSTCAIIAALREDLEKVREATALDEQVSILRQKRDDYRAKGARRDADPQSRVIASLSGGLIPADDVSLVLILVLVIMVELVSAFAPVVVHEFVLTMRSPPRPARGRQVGGRRAQAGPIRTPSNTTKTLVALAPKVGGLYDYLAERVEPDETGILAVSDLWGDYHLWCGNQGFAALTQRAFVSELDALAAGDLRDCIFRRGSSYRGLRLVS